MQSTSSAQTEHFAKMLLLGLQKAMQIIGVDTCIYVGDSEPDVLTAKNLGVKCVSVLWGFRDRETLQAAGAQYFCEDPAKLPAMLDELV